MDDADEALLAIEDKGWKRLESEQSHFNARRQ